MIFPVEQRQVLALAVDINQQAPDLLEQPTRYRLTVKPDCAASLSSQLAVDNQGIFIGDETFVMHGSELHVYNFRGLPQSGIWVGRNCFVGEFCLIRGQGGVHVGDAVLLAPRVQMLAVNHLFDDPSRPVMHQGITAQGIVVEDGAWIGAGAILLDGIRVGTGAVVGAGAVVTRDVPPHTLAVGAPARVVRSLDADMNEDKIQSDIFKAVHVEEELLHTMAADRWRKG